MKPIAFALTLLLIIRYETKAETFPPVEKPGSVVQLEVEKDKRKDKQMVSRFARKAKQKIAAISYLFLWAPLAATACLARYTWMAATLGDAGLGYSAYYCYETPAEYRARVKKQELEALKKQNE